ncbi:MAG: DUF255 domain-containing protein [Myxococcota bacterium]
MANRLSGETSPYLLQHADNPVDWYPWGPEAFAEAARREVPILLSIGYSACHWCHVMERESFQNPLVASRMNSLFVNVKVDREERPDVDELYMRAVQAFNRGGGGWPMTVFLTPEGVPFFGGTYFPPVARGGMPGLVDVLNQVSEIWRRQPEQVQEVTRQITEVLDGATNGPARMLSRDWLTPVASAAAAEQDPIDGGFGGAPKFPPHGTLAALLAQARRTGDEGVLGMVTRTLDAMARGGMYDLVGGGFCRYSVDGQWRIPHFEKMLYDTAQLVPIYVDAWKVTGRERYATVVRESIGWALREMRLESGAFASSLDADSDGREGAYYVFTPDELVAALGDALGLRVAAMLEVTPEGTFEDGTSVIRLEAPRDTLPPGDAAVLDNALPRLRQLRATRTPPARDDKAIVAGNALMISAIARAGAAMGEPEWVAAAVAAYDHLAEAAVVDGRWMRSVKDGRALVPAFADDHANLLVAAVDLYEATFDPRWIAAAEGLARTLVDRFWDAERESLALVGSDQPKLFARTRPAIGGAEPGPVGMAALGLVRLARLSADPAWEDWADKILREAQPWLSRAPRAIGVEALAGAWLAGGAEVAVVGAADDPATAALLDEVRSRYLPFTVVARAAPGEVPLPWLEGKQAVGGKPTAYLCEGHTCQLPTADAEAFGAQLEAHAVQPLPLTQAAGARVHAPPLPTAPEAWLGLDGRPVPTLEALRGQVVVLDFWTHCCINCLHVLPELAAIEERFAGQPVTVLGIHCAKFPAEEIAENVRNAMARHGVHHPVLLDPGHDVWEEYAVRSWPTLVVLDATGKIALHQPGEITREELGKVVEALLGEGRAQGILAAAPPAPGPAAPAEGGPLLRFPGKVHVWPDAFEQEMGAEVSDGEGRLYVSDTGNHRILAYRLTHGEDGWPIATREAVYGAGTPGLTDGAAEVAQFRGPQGVRRFDDTLYVADTDNHALRAVDLRTGAVRTLAGTGRKAVAAPTREGLAAPRSLDLRSPWDVEVMPMKHHHIVFVAMAGSHQLWVYAAGHLGMHTGSGREDHVDGPAAAAALAQPSALALLGRYLLFVDAETSSVRAVDLQSHQVVTVVGRGLFDFGDVDGTAEVVRLQHPLGITFVGDVVYVADTFNGKVKAIGLQSGETTTVLGGDGTLSDPGGIARIGRHLVVADTNHHRLLVVDPADGSSRELDLGT